MGTSTMMFANRMMKTACCQDIPAATSPEASNHDGMLWLIPTQRAV